MGGVLVVVSSLAGSGFSPLAFPFMLWALVPYALLLFVSRQTPNAWAIGGAGAAAIAVEAGIRAAVFIFPRGSTAAIALVFSPALIAAIAMPLGALAGAAFGWAFVRASWLVRIPLVVLAVAILGITFIGFARPELLPTAVAARRAALESIGDPRLVLGADAFTTTIVSDRSAWFQAGDFDGEPGDEIAVIDHDGAELIDPGDLSSRTRVPFGGAPGRLWSWYSRLRRLDDRLVAVQGGGGYQETEVRTLDNTLLWRYRPDPTLPPTALMAADLDADGATEFYASATQHVARLDGAGGEVWTRPASMAVLVAVAPRSESDPSWIVGVEYGRTVHIWNDAGDTVADVPWPGGAVNGIVEWPDARRLVVSGSPAMAIGLDGRKIELPVAEHMTLQQAVSIRWTRDAAPMLAMVLAGPRDVNRWRLQILDSSGQVVYDEVIARPIGVFVARHRSGRSTLLVSGNGLSAIAPVDP